MFCNSLFAASSSVLFRTASTFHTSIVVWSPHPRYVTSVCIIDRRKGKESEW